MNVKTKRIYDAPAKGDGYRVLVDRLWPRGLGKDDARIDHWAKAIAPSTDLRKWFHHDPDRWDEFCQRYRQELEANAEAFDSLVDRIRDEAAGGTVTLLFGARETEKNHAVMLAEILRERV